MLKHPKPPAKPAARNPFPKEPIKKFKLLASSHANPFSLNNSYDLRGHLLRLDFIIARCACHPVYEKEFFKKMPPGSGGKQTEAASQEIRLIFSSRLLFKDVRLR